MKHIKIINYGETQQPECQVHYKNPKILLNYISHYTIT